MHWHMQPEAVADIEARNNNMAFVEGRETVGAGFHRSTFRRESRSLDTHFAAVTPGCTIPADLVAAQASQAHSCLEKDLTCLCPVFCSQIAFLVVKKMRL